MRETSNNGDGQDCSQKGAPDYNVCLSVFLCIPPVPMHVRFLSRRRGSSFRSVSWRFLLSGNAHSNKLSLFSQCCKGSRRMTRERLFLVCVRPTCSHFQHLLTCKNTVYIVFIKYFWNVKYIIVFAGRLYNTGRWLKQKKWSLKRSSPKKSRYTNVANLFSHRDLHITRAHILVSISNSHIVFMAGTNVLSFW